MHPKKEAERFETAIITTAAEPGKGGIVMLPGVKEIMEEVAAVISAVVSQRLTMFIYSP